MAQVGSVQLAMGRENDVKGDLVSLRIGSVNVTSMKRRNGDVVDMTARRRLDFYCLQETGWKGEGARKMASIQVFLDGLCEGNSWGRIAGGRQMDREGAGSEACD